MITVRAMQVKDAEQVSELERMIFQRNRNKTTVRNPDSTKGY